MIALVAVCVTLGAVAAALGWWYRVEGWQLYTVCGALSACAVFVIGTAAARNGGAPTEDVDCSKGAVVILEDGSNACADAKPVGTPVVEAQNSRP